MNNSFSQCNHFHVTVFNTLALFLATFGDQFTATIFLLLWANHKFIFNNFNFFNLKCLLFVFFPIKIRQSFRIYKIWTWFISINSEPVKIFTTIYEFSETSFYAVI